MADIATTLHDHRCRPPVVTSAGCSGPARAFFRLLFRWFCSVSWDFWLQAWPAIQFNGFGFLVSNDWDLGSQYGTPVSVDGQQVCQVRATASSSCFRHAREFVARIVFRITGRCVGRDVHRRGHPAGARDTVAAIVELLAAVPSVVFGLWGYVVVIPVFAHYVYPVMADVLGFIPGLGGPVGAGYGLMTAGVVLALMVVPIITANVREAIAAVSKGDVEAGFALGATRFEVVCKVVLPQVKTAIVGVTILGLGRALGETMAVLMVSGNALDIPSNIYSPFSTMAAFIVSQLDSALQDPTGMAVDSLSEIGLMLLILGVIVNSIARLIMWRVRS